MKHAQFNPIKSMVIGRKRTQVFHAEELIEAKTRMGTKQQVSKNLYKMVVFNIFSRNDFTYDCGSLI